MLYDKDGNALPLNGTKTHPLTDHAKSVLSKALRGPIPAHEVNPGTKNRLDREGLTDYLMLPSPDTGKDIAHLVLTEAGRIAANKETVAK